MSLFDVIKYPVDENFTVDAINNLPHKLAKQWWDFVVFNEKNKPKPRSFKEYEVINADKISRIMNSNLSMGASSRRYYCGQLRKRITTMEYHCSEADRLDTVEKRNLR